MKEIEPFGEGSLVVVAVAVATLQSDPLLEHTKGREQERERESAKAYFSKTLLPA